MEAHYKKLIDATGAIELKAPALMKEIVGV
jgi:hypothetical protein